MKINENSLRGLWDNNAIKCNIHIIMCPEKRGERATKKSEEIIVKNFPNMGKEIATQVQEVQRAL